MPSTMLNAGKDRGKTLTRERGGEAGKRILPSARSAEAGESMGSSGAQGHLTTPGGEGRTGQLPGGGSALTQSQRRSGIQPDKEDVEGCAGEGNSIHSVSWHDVQYGCVGGVAYEKTRHEDFHIISLFTFSEPQFPL